MRLRKCERCPQTQVHTHITSTPNHTTIHSRQYVSKYLHYIAYLPRWVSSVVSFWVYPHQKTQKTHHPCGQTDRQSVCLSVREVDKQCHFPSPFFPYSQKSVPQKISWSTLSLLCVHLEGPPTPGNTQPTSSYLPLPFIISRLLFLPCHAIPPWVEYFVYAVRTQTPDRNLPCAYITCVYLHTPYRCSTLPVMPPPPSM